MTYEQIYELVKDKFKKYPKRFAHMEGVVDMALSLSHHHHLPLLDEKVKLAGLLHDYGKIVDPKELEAIIKQEYEGKFRDVILEVPEIYHAFACPYLLKRDFGIDDSEIGDAVAYHTTGKVGMGLLTQLIFISDYVEEGRAFEEARMVRPIAYQSLDSATAKIYEFSINAVQKAGKKLFLGTVEIYQYYLERMRL